MSWSIWSSVPCALCECAGLASCLDTPLPSAAVCHAVCHALHPTQDGRTPLLIALEERHTALAELLLQVGGGAGCVGMPKRPVHSSGCGVGRVGRGGGRQGGRAQWRAWDRVGGRTRRSAPCRTSHTTPRSALDAGRSALSRQRARGATQPGKRVSSPSPGLVWSCGFRRRPHASICPPACHCDPLPPLPNCRPAYLPQLLLLSPPALTLLLLLLLLPAADCRPSVCRRCRCRCCRWCLPPPDFCNTFLDVLLSSTFIRFGPALVRQICGIPMGISAAPFIANLSRHSAGTAFHRHERV